MSLAFPTIFLLPTRLSAEKLYETEEQIRPLATLTRDIKEAKLVIGKVLSPDRARFELRVRGVWTEDIAPVKRDAIPTSALPRKRQKIEERNSSTESDGESRRRESSVSSTHSAEHVRPAFNFSSSLAVAATSKSSVSMSSQAACIDDDIIRVVKLAWFYDSVKAGVLLPIDEDYLVYQGWPIPKPSQTILIDKKLPQGTVAHAQAKIPMTRQTTPGGRTKGRHARTRPTRLLQESTSDHEDNSTYPALPPYLEIPYSCCWRTPSTGPNDAFISHLKNIQRIRELQGNINFSVKSYGNAIAAIAAYPYKLRSTDELRRLHGCDTKFAQLFQEFSRTGTIQEAESLEKDEQLRVWNEFYEIWGCGNVTAEKFWDMGYRSLDDLVKYCWGSLTREQQIGIKYYSDFQLSISRAEVESIAKVIHDTANENTQGGGFQMLIVGGYRRGKMESGDVDVILSHPNSAATLEYIEPLVSQLEGKGYIKYTLKIQDPNSQRNQDTVSMKSEYSSGNDGRPYRGFCSLDKAYVVWQNPDWPTKALDVASAAKSGTKVINPNPHRRVDIIISPWRTVGCAVAGWSSGRTFERDLRSYCRKERGLKFDSTGVRRLLDGEWVDLEGEVVERDGVMVERGEKGDMVEAEKRVFEGLGLPYLEPEWRCTG